MDIQGAIFDLDGTLFDSMGAWERAGQEYAEQNGWPVDGSLIQILKYKSVPQWAAYFQEQYGATDTQEQIVAQLHEKMAASYLRVPLKDGVSELLEAWKNRGIRMCIATATERSVFEPALRTRGLSGYFSGIVTCAEIGGNKERPDIYLCALELLGTAKANTVVLEDTLHAVRTAARACFPVIGVYDDISAKDRPTIQPLCLRYVFSLRELLCPDMP